MSRDLLLLAASLFTWGLGEGAFFHFTGLYLAELGASPVKIGQILGLIGACMVVAHIPAGYLADRIGRKPLLVTAWVMGLAAAILMATARSLPVFVLGNALYAMTSFVSGPLNSYATAARGRWSVARVITLTSAGFNAGAIFGPLAGGLIAERWGLQYNFVFGVPLFMLSTLMIVFLKPQPVESHESAGPPVPPLRSVLNLLTPNFSRYLLIIAAATFFMYLPQPLSQNFLHEQRSVAYDQMGLLISARGIGVVLLNLSLGALAARYGYLLTHLSMTVFSLLILQGTGLGWYYAAYLLVGSYQTGRSLAAAQGNALVPKAQMGTAYGIIETVFSLVVMLSPLLAGQLYAWRPESMYQIALVGCLLCGGLAFFGIPRPAATPASVETALAKG